MTISTDINRRHNLDRDKAVVQILRKRRKSLAFMIISGIVLVVVLNILITLTNNLNQIKNIASVLLLIVFGIIIYLVVEKIISVYIYLLTEKYLGFGRKVGKKEHITLEIPIKDIVKYESISEMEVDTELSNTYYFIYGEPRETTRFAEYYKEDKKYRVIFNPNERINRILDRKLSD
jgi:hypothetical protein